ncbi:Gustatory receptor 16 [Hyalella azteca]|uniref:Gustatory receptor 16 n=1 Tax=Hyalella azteca TaxID=294128 RepID=A0A6A0HE89_HYAAZ|nr:Gustatory receptor 16 [Hyalella azteca]
MWIKFLHFMLRIFGYMPYKWNTQEVSPKKGQVAENFSLVKSKKWSVWSATLTLGLSSVMCLDIYESIFRSRVNQLNYSTLRVFHTIYDVTMALAVALIQVLCFIQKDKLAHIFLESNNICRVVKGFSGELVYERPTSNRLWVTWLMVTLVLLAVIISLTAYWVFDVVVFDGLTLALLSIRFTAMGLQFCLLGVTFEFFLRQIENCIDAVFKNVIGLGWCNCLTCDNGGDKSLNLVSLKPEKNSPGVEHTQLPQRLEMQPVNWMGHGRNSQRVQDDIMRIYSLLKLLISYMEKIIVVKIMLLIFLGIVDICYLMLFQKLKTSQKLLNTSHTLITMMPLLFFLNLPTSYTEKVAALKWKLMKLAILPTHRISIEQLKRLQYLLDQSPSFDMCHVFTLERSKIVHIFSFAATYVVIFMQFLGAEKN